MGLECRLGSAGLLLEGLLGPGLGLGSGLGLGLGLAAGDLLLLHDLLLQLLLPVDPLLDLVKQALGLRAARVEAVWSGLGSLGPGLGLGLGSRLRLRLGLRSGLGLGLGLPLLELRLLLAARLLLELVLLLPGLLRLLEAGEGGAGRGAGRGLLLGAGPGGSEPVLGVRLQPPDVDVPGEARHRLAVAAVHDDLGHSAVAATNQR